jgi:acetyl-CoA carboxylase biotin carboxyl carrier protein
MDSPDQDLVRLMYQEARDLIKRLEGTTVRRLSVQAGEYKMEIELEANARAVGPVSGPTLLADHADASPDTRASVVSPLVGTFYRAAQPGAKPFVEVGDVVEAGQTVAIVEAMKIMNQVTSEHGGRVAEILVGDGEWVEFHQVLMYLEPVDA